MLTPADIRHALAALAVELGDAPSRCELAVVGGAAVALLYGTRNATKDVDVVVIGGAGLAPVRDAVRRVAISEGLPEDWLNDAAKGYVHGLALGDVVLDAPRLLVRILAVHQLAAMKLSAWRDDVDIEDARLLVARLQGDRETVWAQIEPHIVPGRETKAYFAFCDLWEGLYEPG